MDRTTSLPTAPALPYQFTIRSLLWLMLTAAMVLAYVRPAGERLVSISLVCSLAGIMLAIIFGWAAGRIGQSYYRALLTHTLAMICVAGQPNVSADQVDAWAFLAIVIGAGAGASKPGNLRVKLPICAIVGTLVMLVMVGRRFDLEDLGDVGLALVVSCLVPLLADLFVWARQRYRTSYGAWAAALALAVILGNWGANWLTPWLGEWLASWA